MARIAEIFEGLRARGGRAVMPFVTAGDPVADGLGAVLAGLERGGASVVEVGLPFTDPIADGPVIQASMQRALDRGVTVGQTLAQVRAVRGRLSIGLVAMVSYSIVHRRGLQRFVDEAVAAGFDGFIFPDLSLEAAGPAREACAAAGATLSLLVAPNTPMDRARDIAAASTGFVYVLARSGVTGARAALPADLPARLAGLREVTDLPLAVGFGVSTAEQVASVTAVADAAIVGSAMVDRLLHAGEDTGDGASAVGAAAEAFTRELASGLPQAAGAPAGA